MAVSYRRLYSSAFASRLWRYQRARPRQERSRQGAERCRRGGAAVPIHASSASRVNPSRAAAVMQSERHPRPASHTTRPRHTVHQRGQVHNHKGLTQQTHGGSGGDGGRRATLDRRQRGLSHNIKLTLHMIPRTRIDQHTPPRPTGVDQELAEKPARLSRAAAARVSPESDRRPRPAPQKLHRTHSVSEGEHTQSQRPHICGGNSGDSGGGCGDGGGDGGGALRRLRRRPAAMVRVMAATAAATGHSGHWSGQTHHKTSTGIHDTQEWQRATAQLASCGSGNL